MTNNAGTDAGLSPDVATEAGQWVSLQQAAVILGKAEKTIGVWANAGRLQRRKTTDGRTEIFVLIPPEPEVKPTPAESNRHASAVSPEFTELVREVLEVTRENRDLARQLLDERAARLKAEAEAERKADAITLLNVEREGSNALVVRAKNDRQDSERLRGENERLRAEIAEQKRINAEQMQKSQGFRRWPWGRG